MPKTMKERFDEAKIHQREVAYKRPNKKYKIALAIKHVAKHRDGLLMEQLGLCAICEVPVTLASKRYHLDHDHDTGEIRGVLCHGCNIGLGMFKDDPRRMLKAIDYLNKFRLDKIEYELKNAELVPENMIKPVEQSESYEGVLSPEEFDKLPGVEKIAYLRSLEGKTKNWWDTLPELMNYQNVK